MVVAERVRDHGGGHVEELLADGGAAGSCGDPRYISPYRLRDAIREFFGTEQPRYSEAAGGLVLGVKLLTS